VCCCIVILLLVNELQMSVRRFSAIPHLRGQKDDPGTALLCYWDSFLASLPFLSNKRSNEITGMGPARLHKFLDR